MVQGSGPVPFFQLKETRTTIEHENIKPNFVLFTDEMKY